MDLCLEGKNMLHAEIIMSCWLLYYHYPSTVKCAPRFATKCLPFTFYFRLGNLILGFPTPSDPPTIAIRLKFAQPQRRVKMYYLLL